MSPRGSRRVRGRVGVLALGLATALAGRAGEDATLTEAARLLGRMTAALGSLDYRGTLVYLADNRLETLELVHRVGRDGVEERLVSLSGPPRRLARGGEGLTCELPDTAPLRVAPGAHRRSPSAAPIDPAALAEHYRVEVPGSTRVVGRDAEVLRLRPRDGLRYGNEFHLDRASGLPLKSDLIDDRGEPVEQLLFTAIEFATPPADLATLAAEGADADPPAATAAPSKSAPPGPLPSQAPPSEPPPWEPEWRFEGRASGFELALVDRLEDAQGRPVLHYLFSDRLSSYSVYIEDGAAPGLDGTTRIGAVHAAGRLVDGYRVTAVGEVPAATVAAAVAGAALAPGQTPTKPVVGH